MAQTMHQVMTMAATTQVEMTRPVMTTAETIQAETMRQEMTAAVTILLRPRRLPVATLAAQDAW